MDYAEVDKKIKRLERLAGRRLSEDERESIEALVMSKDASARLLGASERAKRAKKAQPWLMSNAQAGRKYAESMDEDRMLLAYLEGKVENLNPRLAGLKKMGGYKATYDDDGNEQLVKIERKPSLAEERGQLEAMRAEAIAKSAPYAPPSHLPSKGKVFDELRRVGANVGNTMSVGSIVVDYRAAKRGVKTEDPFTQKILDEAGAGKYKGFGIQGRRAGRFPRENEGASSSTSTPAPAPAPQFVSEATRSYQTSMAQARRDLLELSRQGGIRTIPVQESRDQYLWERYAREQRRARREALQQQEEAGVIQREEPSIGEKRKRD